jgi:hypothetical protein
MKYCEDCKSLKKLNVYSDSLRCFNEDACYDGIQVVNRITTITGIPARRARDKGSPCGLDGKLWQPND